MTDDRALAVRDESALDLTPRFVTSIDDLAKQLEQLEQFKRNIMIEGVDFGTIPGTPKPTLLKPGAEKLSLAFGLAPTFETVNAIEDWDRGFFHYEERCVLTSRRSGAVVASANGSCNTRESRYRWRTSGGTCPACSHDVKHRRDGGAWCPKDQGGCGKNFSADTAPKRQRVENTEPYELVNTVKKMAQKRALVAATLIGTGGSGIWTQDLEDHAEDERVIDVTPAPPRQEATKTGPKPGPKPRQVSNERVRLEGRYLSLLEQARERGLHDIAAEFDPNWTDEQLISAGSTLSQLLEPVNA